MREASLAREMHAAGARSVQYLYMGSVPFFLAQISSMLTLLYRLLRPLLPKDALQGRVRAVIPARSGGVYLAIACGMHTAP